MHLVSRESLVLQNCPIKIRSRHDLALSKKFDKIVVSKLGKSTWVGGRAVVLA